MIRLQLLYMIIKNIIPIIYIEAPYPNTQFQHHQYIFFIFCQTNINKHPFFSNAIQLSMEQFTSTYNHITDSAKLIMILL